MTVHLCEWFGVDMRGRGQARPQPVWGPCHVPRPSHAMSAVCEGVPSVRSRRRAIYGDCERERKLILSGGDEVKPHPMWRSGRAHVGYTAGVGHAM